MPLAYSGCQPAKCVGEMNISNEERKGLAVIGPRSEQMDEEHGSYRLIVSHGLIVSLSLMLVREAYKGEENGARVGRHSWGRQVSTWM